MTPEHESSVHQPQAFLSYARFDDRSKRVTKLHGLVADEVRSITGAIFPIFQDSEDIRTGEQWRQRLEEGLVAATLLIPILTPSFLSSDYCRSELATFLEEERRRDRSDLVLGLHYIDAALDEREGDELVEAIRERQLFDWRAYELRAFSDPPVRRALREFAREIVAAIARVTGRRLAEARPAVRGEGARARLSLLLEIPPELAATDLPVGVAGTFNHLEGDLPLWRPVPMMREDDRHWRLALEGIEGEEIAYKYVLGPELGWQHPEMWRTGAFRDNRVVRLGVTPVQHDIVEAWEGAQPSG